MKPRLEQVEDAVIRFVEQGGDFDETLERVIAYQRAWNPELARFWSGRGFTERSVPASVPAVPTDVFRRVRLVSTERPSPQVFRTSGTTAGARGEHHRLSTRVYDVGAPLQFKRLVLPDLESVRFVMMVFDPQRVPDSSLSHMAQLLDRRYGQGNARYHVSSEGVDVSGLRSELERLDEPVVVLSTAFAMVQLLDALAGERLMLPSGSRIVETGGFKGRSRTVERGALYASMAATFAVDEAHIISEYSMTELSSQLYDNTLLSNTTESPRRLVPPHWCRVEIVSPDTLEPLAEGETGLIRFVDLANVDTVVAVQTSDLGRLDRGGLELFGRADQSTPRGCSLAIEEIERRVER